MSRTLTSAVQTELAADHARTALLFEAAFDGATLYMWNGLGELVHGGNTYVGGGTLINVDAVRENAEMRADSTRITLSGIPSEMISIALQEDYQGRAIYVDMAFLNEGGAVISDPVRVITGRADQMTIDDNGETATIGVTVESEVARFERSSARRLTPQGLRSIYPGDKGLDFVPRLQNTDIRWGPN